MYIQKEEIKSGFLPTEKKLKFLFDQKKIEEFNYQIDLRKKSNQPISQYALQMFQHFKSILTKNQRALEILHSPKTDWKINKIDQHSQLAVKVAGTNVELRYEGILSTNIQNLCIMIYQVNLFNHWVPFCSKGEDLKEVSSLQKICYLQFKIPFLSERFAYFYGLGMDRIDHNGTIVIYGEGITENEELLAKFNITPDKKKQQKMVILDLKFFICEISYKSQNQFIFRSFCELDSRMPMLPQWILNTVIKQMGGFIFDRVVKQSLKFKGSVWQAEMKRQANNPFYSWLHDRIEAWHQMKKNEKVPMISKI